MIAVWNTYTLLSTLSQTIGDPKAQTSRTKHFRVINYHFKAHQWHDTKLKWFVEIFNSLLVHCKSSPKQEKNSKEKLGHHYCGTAGKKNEQWNWVMPMSGLPLDSVIPRFSQLPIFLSKNSEFSTCKGHFWSRISAFFNEILKVINRIQSNFWKCPLKYFEYVLNTFTTEHML